MKTAKIFSAALMFSWALSCSSNPAKSKTSSAAFDPYRGPNGIVGETSGCRGSAELPAGIEIGIVYNDAGKITSCDIYSDICLKISEEAAQAMIDFGKKCQKANFTAFHCGSQVACGGIID